MKPYEINMHTSALRAEAATLRERINSIHRPIDRVLYYNCLVGVHILIGECEFTAASAVIATLDKHIPELQPMGRNFSETQPDIEEK